MAEPTPPRTYVLSGHAAPQAHEPLRAMLEQLLYETHGEDHLREAADTYLAHAGFRLVAIGERRDDLALGDHHVGVGR